MKYPWNFATPFALFPKSRLALATCHLPARKAGLRAVVPAERRACSAPSSADVLGGVYEGL